MRLSISASELRVGDWVLLPVVDLLSLALKVTMAPLTLLTPLLEGLSTVVAAGQAIFQALYGLPPSARSRSPLTVYGTFP